MESADDHGVFLPLEPQLHKPNRCWMPRRLMGVSPDTRRTLPVDNFDPPGGVSTLRWAP